MKKPVVFFLTLMFCASVFSGALGQDLKVGTLFDHTGALQEWGPNFQNAAQLAAKHLASAGFSIEFIHEDSETAAIPAKKSCQKADGGGQGCRHRGIRVKRCDRARG